MGDGTREKGEVGDKEGEKRGSGRGEGYVCRGDI
jgi:hypothetical protein